MVEVLRAVVAAAEVVVAGRGGVMSWRLRWWQFLALSLGSCAFPVGVFLMNHGQVPGAVVLCFVNLPFLVLLAPFLMALEFSPATHQLAYILSWLLIFAQAYLAFVGLRYCAGDEGVAKGGGF